MIRISYTCLMIVAVAACQGAARPDVEQVKSDLIGQETGDLLRGGWKFASLSEFLDLSIEQQNESGAILEYAVEMHLQDISTGREYRAEALVTYRKVDRNWQFAAVSLKRLERWRARRPIPVPIDTLGIRAAPLPAGRRGALLRSSQQQTQAWYA